MEIHGWFLINSNANIYMNSKEDSITPGMLVDYEQHGKPILGWVINDDGGGKWRILNEQGKELSLHRDRLYAFPEPCPKGPPTLAMQGQLQALLKAAEDKKKDIDLPLLWELACDNPVDYPVRDLLDVYCQAPNILDHLSLRRALVADTIYFKRKKDVFQPRSSDAVAQMIQQKEVHLRKQEERDKLLQAILARLSGIDVELPSTISTIERFVITGDKLNDVDELVREINERSNLKKSGNPQEDALEILIRIGHFDRDENLSLRRSGQPVEFSAPVLEEAMRIAQNLSAQYPGDEHRKDLRSLTVITIDSEETKDIDDGLSLEVEGDGLKLGIHISDVSWAVLPESLLEQEAVCRASSVYLTELSIPMLPHLLSEDVFSLVEGKDRRAVSVFLKLDAQGRIISREVVSSFVKVSRRLTYEAVDEVLFGEQVSSQDPTEYRTMFERLWDLSVKLEFTRQNAGAVYVQKKELRPVINEQREISIQDVQAETPARKIVSELMILANETFARFASSNDIPFIYRSQEPPEVDIEACVSNIEEGPARDFARRSLLKRSIVSAFPSTHFGLGLPCYTQVTSPIRRIGDLLSQRQIVSFLQSGKAHALAEELEDKMTSASVGLQNARVLQRDRERYWFLKYIVQEKIRSLEGVIVKLAGPKPLVELEALGLIMPFRPAKKFSNSLEFRSASRDSNADWVVSRGDLTLGQKISLSVVRVDPRSDDLVLAQER